MKQTLEITIPVLNEEETIEEKVLELHNYMFTNVSDVSWKIIIADNGSTDRTPTLAENLCKAHPEIEYLRVGERGVGLALKKSWLNSKADIIACMDLDLSTDVKYIGESLNAILKQNYQMVYASRLHKKSQVIGRSFKRECTSRVFNFILKTYLSVKISDGMCGFIFINRELFPKIYDSGAQSNRWFFQAEVLVISDWMKLRIFELPIKWIDDPNSKVNVVALAKEYLSSMIVLRKKMRLIKKNAQ